MPKKISSKKDLKKGEKYYNTDSKKLQLWIYEIMSLH